MAQSKRETYERKREHVKELVADGELNKRDADSLLEWCDAYDPENATTTPNDADSDANRWGSTRQPSTLRAWLLAVTPFIKEVDGSIRDASADELNEAAQRMYDGESDAVQKALSKNSIRSKQNALKKFLRHIDGEATPDEIATFDKQSTVVDPEDMLTREEFHALRQAPEHPRDRAIADLFLYTGQRNTALRTLRIKDIDLDDGKYRLNSDADGLKGADRIGTWNPLLGAVGSIRDWLNHHPAPDDPNAYLLTECRHSVVRDPHSTISGDTVNRVLREAARVAMEEEPGIKNKPTHAHAMRHNFVTMCKRDYDLDDDVIKRLIRHKPESDVMNTTYAHLSDSDYIQKAEEAFGLREEEDESPMTPDHCDQCREPLPPYARSCPRCGADYAPDSVTAQEKLKDDVEEKKEEAETLDRYKLLDKLDKLAEENPELVNKLEDL